MECPRCGSHLERYALGDRTALTCDECGYAGVPVDHHGELRTAETWADALSRVPDAGQIASVTVETATETPALELVFESSPDTDDTSPAPTTVRVERPDPALAAALEAAEADDEKFVCEVCGRAFERREQLYGHLAVHADDDTEGT
jgi:DNA-directed RNA polymerase subunit M/transcription elongation factor TFIIS